jgi:hypothetical protein
MAIDVASWLQQLSLAQHEPAFRDNEVDEDVLPNLTAEHRIGLGVTDEVSKHHGPLAALGLGWHRCGRRHRCRYRCRAGAGAAAPSTAMAEREPVSADQSPPIRVVNSRVWIA